MKLNGKLNFFVSEDSTTIELIDAASSKRFCVVKLTPEQLSLALSRRSHVPCEIDLYHDERIGKQMETDNLEFELPKGVDKWAARNNEQLLQDLSLKHCPEGWIPDKYYGSQNSFFTKDGKDYARTIIRRWV